MSLLFDKPNTLYFSLSLSLFISTLSLSLYLSQEQVILPAASFMLMLRSFAYGAHAVLTGNGDGTQKKGHFFFRYTRD